MTTEVVYGPPGCGKTTYLMSKMGDLKAAGALPHEIGLVAFTRAAAREALTRLNLGSSKTIRTLHSLAYEVCEVSREQVIDSAKLVEFGELVGYPMRGNKSTDEEEQTVGDQMFEICQVAEAMQVSIDEVFERTRPDLDLDVTTLFRDSYRVWKDSYGYIDFNDMLTGMVERNPDVGIRHLFVDEGQDLSPLQWSVVRGLMAHATNITVAGDDDQAIYTWAGADAHGMSRVDGAPRVLSQSYRVPRRAHRLAQEVIGRVSQRVEKEYSPRREEGTTEEYPSLQYIDAPKGDTLLLYRNHSQRGEAERWLMENYVPYTMVGSVQHGAFENHYANAVRAFNLLRAGQEISMNQLGCMQKVAHHWFREQISAKDFSCVKKLPWDEVLEMPYEQADYLRGVDLSSKPLCRMSTIHSAKGMEADDVILVNAMGARTYEQMNDDEHRVWYVAVTRTRHHLTIISGDNPYDLPTGA